MKSPAPAAQLRRTLIATAAVVASTAVAAPALAAPSGAYRGKTSQGKRVSLKVAGKKVNRFTFAYSAPCNDGRKLTGTFTFNPVDLEDRKFAIQGSSSGELSDGTPTASTLKLTGRFNTADSRARGTVSIRTELRTATGDGIATCRTGRLTYLVKKRVR